MANINEGWSKQTADISVIETGFTYTFKKNNTHFIAVAYPVELGELKHIYQNELYSFDLLDSFEKKIVLYNNKECYLYRYPDEALIDNDKFEFLWKDKK